MKALQQLRKSAYRLTRKFQFSYHLVNMCTHTLFLWESRSECVWCSTFTICALCVIKYYYCYYYLAVFPPKWKKAKKKTIAKPYKFCVFLWPIFLWYTPALHCANYHTAPLCFYMFIIGLIKIFSSFFLLYFYNTWVSCQFCKVFISLNIVFMLLLLFLLL